MRKRAFSAARAAWAALSLASVAGAAGAVSACAGNDETPSAASNEQEAGTVVSDASTTPSDGSDAGAPDAAHAPDADGATPTCSADGWCLTALPDSSLNLVDVWPASDRAFALAESASLGVKVLQWDSATNAWSAIDDGTQNGFPGAATQTNLWAPNADEVYFAISDSGTSGAFVYHGTRPAAPATTFTWSRLRFDCDHTDPTPQVWGTSVDDVYVLACGAIHRLNGAGAGTELSSATEWTDDDADHPLTLFGATGTADDLWFVGTRGWDPGQCAVVVRKTTDGYQRIVDGIPSDDYYSCNAKDEYPKIGGAFRAGFSSFAKGHFIGLRYSDSPGNALVRIVANDDGSYDVASSAPPAAMGVNLRSFWGVSEDDLWLVSTRGGGGGILRGTSLWAEGGSYTYSTLALGSAPNFQALRRIRGTSNTNLWAVGDDRAFHKTTP